MLKSHSISVNTTVLHIIWKNEEKTCHLSSAKYDIMHRNVQAATFPNKKIQSSLHNIGGIFFKISLVPSQLLFISKIIKTSIKRKIQNGMKSSLKTENIK